MVKDWYKPQDFGFDSAEDLEDSAISVFVEEIEKGGLSTDELEKVIKACELRIKYIKAQDQEKVIDNFYKAFDALDKAGLVMICYGGPFPYDVYDRKDFDIMPKNCWQDKEPVL